MKVLVISSRYPNRINPYMGTYVHELVKKLKSFCDVRVISPVSMTPPLAITRNRFLRQKEAIKWLLKIRTIPRQDVVQGVNTYHPRIIYPPEKFLQFNEGWILFLRLLPMVLRLRCSFRFDLIHSHFAFPEGFAGALLARVLGLPSVITCYGSDINYGLAENPFVKNMILIGLRTAQLVIPVSNTLKGKIMENLNLNGKLQVIPNGVDVNTFFPQDKNNARRNLGLPINSKIVLFVGSMCPAKGLNYLIDAFEIVAKTQKSTRLFLLGEGVLRRALLRKVKNLGLNNKVFFLGNVPYHQIPLWMNASDMFVLPSLNEGCPTVVPEALACGRPVVASNVGGISEIIASDDYGLLTAPRDYRELAEKIKVGLAKQWDKERLVSQAKQCDWKIIAKQHFKYYQQLVPNDELYEKIFYNPIVGI